MAFVILLLVVFVALGLAREQLGDLTYIAMGAVILGYVLYALRYA